MTAAFPGDHDAGIRVLGDARPRRGVPARLLRLASDDRLVEYVRAGSESAFEALFDRHHRGVLGFCRHMLGSVEEAEDAVQHTFLSAYRELVGTDKHLQLRPWLYTIARNRCLTMLRGRSRVTGAEVTDPPTEHLAAAVERRSDLRDLLRDVAGLPEDQRAALVLSEIGDMAHDEIADVLGCRRDKVKALVFQARSSLIASRTARETPCAEIREQLANLRGGSLRRNELRRHINDCAGCREFRDQVRAQRRDLALVLPVAPTVGLKSAVLGGGSAAAIAGTGGGAATGAVAAKVLVVAALAGGGTLAVRAEVAHKAPAAPARHAPRVVPAAAPAGSVAPAATELRAVETAPGAAPARSDNPGRAVGHGKPKKGAKGPTPASELKPRHGKPATPGRAAAKPEKAAKPAKAAKPEKAAKPGKGPKPKAAAKPGKPAKAVKAPKPAKPVKAKAKPVKAKAPRAAKPVKAPKPPKVKPPKPVAATESPKAATPAAPKAPSVSPTTPASGGKQPK